MDDKGFMKLKAIQQTFYDALDVKYEKEEITNFFFLLTEAYFNLKRIDLAMNPEIEVENNTLILEALEQLKQDLPIQYIIGKTDFFGLPFKVNNNVLIPRPETEELISWIIEQFRIQNSEFRILDIGTGSGCIAIALAKNLPKAFVYAIDVSEKALEVAKKNAVLNEVQVEFIQADILKDCHAELVSVSQNKLPKFDIIVSNPPYVREQEKNLMQPNVLDNEPHLALFVKDNNPLLFYETISEYAKKALNENGQLFFEINEYLGSDTVAVLRKNNFKNIELKQDIFGKDRMVKGENL